MQSGLIIRERWINLILKGEKTWEMRSQNTNNRGPIALIQQGTGLVLGTARLIDSLAPLSPETYMAHCDKHAIPVSMLDEVLAARWIYPWVLLEARRLPVPVPYAHKSGAVTFVRLESSVSEAITRQGTTSPSSQHLAVAPKPAAPAKALVPPMSAPSPKPTLDAAGNQRPSGPAPTAQTFCFRSEHAQAYGYPDLDGGFVVTRGSTAMRDGSPRVKRDRKLRDQLLRRGVLAPDNDPRLYRFSADYIFGSASQAAGVVKDGNASGPQLWIDETTGKSLRDYANQARGRP